MLFAIRFLQKIVRAYEEYEKKNNPKGKTAGGKIVSLFMEIETDRKLLLMQENCGACNRNISLIMKCPYETEVSLLLTTDEEIKEINRMQRQIDRATDVLSFLWQIMRHREIFRIWMKMPDCFIPIQELMLGDIVISVDKVFEQAEEYGHSLLREYAFNCAQHASFIWLRSWKKWKEKKCGDASKRLWNL